MVIAGNRRWRSSTITGVLMPTTAAGFGPHTVGIGTRITLGAGHRFTTGDGAVIPPLVGSGFRITSGDLPGSAGVTPSTIVDGPRYRRALII